MGRIFYVVYLWLFFVPVSLVLTIFTAVTVIIGCLSGGGKIFAYYPGTIWSRLTCYPMLCPVMIRGRKHIDRKQSYIFVVSHQGAFDIFLIYDFLGIPTKWVMKAGITKILFVGAACRVAGFIFVDSPTPKAAARSALEAERCLRNGASVVVLPEGSHMYDGKMIRFKKGAYQVALDQYLSIIPITLNGPPDVLLIGSLSVHHHWMEMMAHPAVFTGNIDTSRKGMQAFADQTQEVIVSALWEEYK